MDARGSVIALLSVLFLALSFGTTTGLFRLSLLEGTPAAAQFVMAALGGFGLLYAWKGRDTQRR